MYAQRQGKSVMTFEKATKLLGAKDVKKIYNNTYLERCEGRYTNTFWQEPPITECIAIRFHGTQIIKIFPNKTWELNTGGWDTVLTRFRIEDYSPAHLFRHGKTYLTNTVYVETTDDPIREFADMLDKNDGRPSLPWIVKWSGFGVDPVRAAWNASKDLLAMASLIKAYGDSTYKQLSIPGIDVKPPPKKYRFFANKMIREVEHHRLSVPQAMALLRKFTKPPSLKEVLASKRRIDAREAFYERTEFYDGIIVDSSGREVKP